MVLWALGEVLSEVQFIAVGFFFLRSAISGDMHYKQGESRWRVYAVFSPHTEVPGPKSYLLQAANKHDAPLEGLAEIQT